MNTLNEHAQRTRKIKPNYFEYILSFTVYEESIKKINPKQLRNEIAGVKFSQQKPLI